MSASKKKLSTGFTSFEKAMNSAKSLSARFKRSEARVSSHSGGFEKTLMTTKENLLFFKRMLKNPKTLGAIAPSSHALCAFISKQIDVTSDGYFVEIGAGTGNLSMALLQAGIDPKRLFVVELDHVLAEFLRHKLPKGVEVMTGDARSLSVLIPDEIKGNVETVISGIPMMNISAKMQTELIQASFEIMRPKGSFLQFTYGPLSPLPAKKLGLKKTRIGHVLLNIPPASVWRYEKKERQE